MQKRFFLAPAAVVVFILSFTVFGERGLLMINRLHRDRDEMQQRLTELKGENEKLKREIAALQSDRRYLESIARRDFGLVRSNETIYQFPPTAQHPPVPAQQKAAAEAKTAPAQEKPQAKGAQQGAPAPAKPEQNVSQRPVQKSPGQADRPPAPKAEHKPAAKGEKKDEPNGR